LVSIQNGVWQDKFCNNHPRLNGATANPESPKMTIKLDCVVNNMVHATTKVLLLSTSNPAASQAGHVQSASVAGCWLKTVRSDESLCS